MSAYVVPLCVYACLCAEINLDTSHKEFNEWCWMPLDQLPQTVVHFKKSVYEAVAAEFGPVVAAIRQCSQQQQ